MSVVDPSDDDPRESSAREQHPSRGNVPPRSAAGDHADPDQSDLDAEFARLTAGLDFDDTPLTMDDIVASSQSEAEPAIAVVATSVASAQALAGAIRLGREARTDGTDIPPGTMVYEAESGAIAAGDLSEADAHDLAAVTSTALQRNSIVLFWRRGDRMTATRYTAGQRGDDIPAALVLGALDEMIEELLLGTSTLADLGRGLDPSAISRSEALQWIARGRKRR